MYKTFLSVNNELKCKEKYNFNFRKNVKETILIFEILKSNILYVKNYYSFNYDFLKN